MRQLWTCATIALLTPLVLLLLGLWLLGDRLTLP